MKNVVKMSAPIVLLRVFGLLVYVLPPKYPRFFSERNGHICPVVDLFDYRLFIESKLP